MRLKLSNPLRKVADWDVRLQLAVLGVMFVVGLSLVFFEDCGETDSAASNNDAVGRLSAVSVDHLDR
jgi:hypothetical protein